MTQRPIGSRSPGFALVIVLWSLGMLALLGTQMTATTRVQMRLAAQSRDQATAEAAADGAIREATFILLGGGRLGSAARPMQVRIGEVNVEIQAEDEATKINPNTVSKDAWRGVLVSAGVDPARAALLAAEIADWRARGESSTLGGLKVDQYRDHGLPYGPGDHAFYSVDELGLIPDMTPDILARLRPRLSVYRDGDANDLSDASASGAPTTGTGISGVGANDANSSGSNIVMRVTAIAPIPGRAQSVSSAVVRIRTEEAAELETASDLVQILTWE